MVNKLINLNKLIQDFKEFVFNIVFLVGLIVGLILGMLTLSIILGVENTFWNICIVFIIGIVTGCWSNYLWEKHKKKQRGDEPYLNFQASTTMIYFEGQLPNTESNQAAIFETQKKVTPS